MSAATAIEWAYSTWNPVIGCTVVSPGCTHCYAMRLAPRLAAMSLAGERKYGGLTVPSRAGPVWTGGVRLDEESLGLPLRWHRRRRIFVNSMGDLFHEALPDEWIDRVFAVMALCPQHAFLVLTKRAERMRDYLGSHDVGARWACAGFAMIGDIIETPAGAVEWTRHGLPNVWLGVSVEDQRGAEERIPLLLDTPAAVRWISAEPLLGPIELMPWLAQRSLYRGDTVSGFLDFTDALDWVICGGESGPDARPMHPDWARSLRDQCVGAGVPFFFKQWGEWAPLPEGSDPEFYDPEALHFVGEGGNWMRRVGKRAAGRLLDGREWSEFPAPVAAPAREAVRR